MRFAHLLIAGLVASLLAACGDATSGRSPGPWPPARLANGAAASTLPAAFGRCGATQTPPASVLAPPASDLPPVLNQAAGEVGDSTAKQWAAAFWREQAIESWAASAGEEGLLRSPCLSSARVRLAIPAGGRPAGRSQLERVLRLTIAVTSLPMLESLVLRHGGNPSRHVVEETVVAAGQLDTLVVGGVYQDGPIGPLWFVEASGLDCLDPDAAGLGLECGPATAVPAGSQANPSTHGGDSSGTTEVFGRAA
jgi:hypothetical protein